MKRSILMAVCAVLVCGSAWGQSQAPINLHKLSGSYACTATKESLARYQKAQEQAEEQARKQAEEQAAAQQAQEQAEAQQAQEPAQSQEEPAEAQEPSQEQPAETQEPPAETQQAQTPEQAKPKPKRPPSRRLSVRIVVQSAGYPIMSVENEELQGLGRAVQLRNKKTREVTFLLNFAALASFALHFEKAVGPISAQLWRAEEDGSTTLYDYDCVRK